MRLILEKELVGDSDSTNKVQGLWCEYVNDLWQNSFPQLQNAMTVSMCEPAAIDYGFREISENDVQSEFTISDFSDIEDDVTEEEFETTGSEDELCNLIDCEENDFALESVPYQEAKEKAKIPFIYHRIIMCDENEKMITISEHDISLKVPEGAVILGETVYLEIAVTLSGPFTFEQSDEVQPISPILWLCVQKNSSKLVKPFQIVLPHFLTGLSKDSVKEYNICFSKATHTNALKQNVINYNFQQCTTESLFTSAGCKSYGILAAEHCCFYCIQANVAAHFALDAEYCLVRIQRPSILPSISEIHFVAVYFLPTCIQVRNHVFA